MKMETFKGTALLTLTSMMLFGCSGDMPDVCKGTNGVGKGVVMRTTLHDGEFVRASYLSVLQREPDLAGLYAHCRMLKKGEISRTGLIESFMGGAEYKALRSN